MLGEAKARLFQAEKVNGISRRLGITEQPYYRWHNDYGGVKLLAQRAGILKAL
jgi:hypothetical protein